jgi:hypothetical protein
MALVRKTDKIKDEINKTIDDLEINKVNKLFASLDLKELAQHFMETSYHNGMFFPKQCIDGMRELNNPVYTNVFEIYPPTCSLAVVGQHAAGGNQEIKRVIFSPPPGFELPCAHSNKPMMAFFQPHEMGIFFGGDFNSSRNHFSIVMLLPHIVEGKREKNPAGIPSISTGFSSQTVTTLEEKALILEHDSFPAPVQEAWNALKSRRDHIWQVIEKFENTRAYIFNQLWQFPSINKMIEFFPNLKGLLSDETVGRYMKGTSGKKSEYQVVAPTADIIGATVEANMGIHEEDD